MSLFHQIIPFIIEKDTSDLKPQQSIPIYYELYWKDEWDDIGLALAACMLDTAVTMGMKEAKKFFDRCDGSHVVYLQLRIAKYKDMIHKNPRLKPFEKDWMDRVTDLRRFIDGKIQNPD